MHIVHLTASSSYGGPERQILGLAACLPDIFSTSVLTFSEGGRCRPFVGQAQSKGIAAKELASDTPDLRGGIREIARHLRETDADVLVAHGYKSNLLGRPAARRVRVPIISVSRGWTGENRRVSVYDALDKIHLRYMDGVVCVSAGQAKKVRQAGVPQGKIHVIRNAARLDDFHRKDPAYRERLRDLVGGDGPFIVAAGRLSPEKGFDVLVEAAKRVVTVEPTARFVLFGDGPDRDSLAARIRDLHLTAVFAMPGRSDDLDGFLPWADLVVLPSFTEGLPNVALEAAAASVPIVATAVGGTPEVVEDGRTGHLVPPGDPAALARRMIDLCANATARREMGDAGRRRMEAEFSFSTQAREYQALFERVCFKSSAHRERVFA